MFIRTAALAGVFVFHALPALGQNHTLTNIRGHQAQPKPIAALSLGARRIEMLAVTQRARADTPLRKAYLHECKSMDKVFPGYPQPAFVSVDFRVRF